MTSNEFAHGRLAQNFEAALSHALSSLTGKDFAVTGSGSQEWPAEAESSFIWQQAFSIVDGPAFWLVATAELWEALGRQTLEAAGIDEASTEEIRSTWQEIVSQTASGLANALAANLVRDVSATGGEILAAEPEEKEWTVFTVSEGGWQWQFKVAWADSLAAYYVETEAGRMPVAANEQGGSRTLDLLLDVAMEVCVSFGKTSLQIREVLKLSTGSIVELNRFVSDPVDVIVNDCVIARGEVVVVDGNYGVRINHLASREDRLRTGMNEATTKGK